MSERATIDDVYRAIGSVIKAAGGNGPGFYSPYAQDVGIALNRLIRATVPRALAEMEAAREAAEAKREEEVEALATDLRALVGPGAQPGDGTVRMVTSEETARHLIALGWTKGGA